MTKFVDTDMADKFIAEADSRRTSVEVMREIARCARDYDDAVAIWEHDFADTRDLVELARRAVGCSNPDQDRLDLGDVPLADMLFLGEWFSRHAQQDDPE